MLRYKHLQYFGPTGSAIWHGNVYSQVRMDSFFTRPVIYHGIFGTGLFQCIYPKRYSPFAALLSSLEWLAVTLFIFFLSMPLAWLRLIPLVMFGLTLIVGLTYMAQARIETKFDSIPARLFCSTSPSYSRGVAPGRVISPGCAASARPPPSSPPRRTRLTSP
jgi:hypothetical protein